jgi:hypothetical protein
LPPRGAITHQNSLQTILLDQLPNQIDTLLIRPCLGAQVGQIIRQVSRPAAAGILGRLDQHVLPDSLLVEVAVADEFDGLDCGSFLPQFCRIRRQGASGDSPNVCMVASRGDIEDDFPIFEEGSDDRDIRKMRAATDFARQNERS